MLLIVCLAQIIDDTNTFRLTHFFVSTFNKDTKLNLTGICQSSALFFLNLISNIEKNVILFLIFNTNLYCVCLKLFNVFAKSLFTSSTSNK